MLYERWRNVAQERGQEFALADWASGQRWTFQGLLVASDAAEPPPGAVVFPQGNRAEFVFEVLRGWRHERLVCPLEVGQARPVIPQPPQGIAHLKTTSATTKAARWVAFTAAQLAADAENILSTMGLRPDWPNLGLISLAHSYGFSNLVLPLLLHGIPLILVPSPLPEALRQAAQKHTALTLAGVPALWRTWHAAGGLPRNIRLAISAGAPLPLDLERSVFAATGLKLHNFYGASECGGIAYDRSHVPRSAASLAGSAMDNVSLSVGAGSCLVVSGANVGESFWPDPGPELAIGRFQTSDLAELRKGQVHLLGRAGEVIHVAGRKVNPETIEAALRQHPGVQDCVVLGLPEATGQRGEIIAAVVQGESVGATALREFLLQQLPAWQVPREWRITAERLTNERGKISRAKWREQFGG
jgi:acyl-CoA synthetase (AMP-forming)/AMP-acid ligase II